MQFLGRKLLDRQRQSFYPLWKGTLSRYPFCLDADLGDVSLPPKMRVTTQDTEETSRFSLLIQNGNNADASIRDSDYLLVRNP